MATIETTREKTNELKELVRERRPRAWALGYPDAVRDRVCAYVSARRTEGATAGTIAAELGLSRHSVVAWTAPSSAACQMRRVEVVPDVELAWPRPACGASLVLVSPKGYRVEGLDVSALAALLRMVG